MNHRAIRIIPLCISAVLLLTACQSQEKTLLPVTGANDVSLAAPAALARDNVLQYLLVSSRLAALPPSTEWQLVEDDEQLPTVYQFQSGDWLMLVRLADSRQANQEVILINKAAQASWSGYITPAGRVVDTAYGR